MTLFLLAVALLIGLAAYLLMRGSVEDWQDQVITPTASPQPLPVPQPDPPPVKPRETLRLVSDRGKVLAEVTTDRRRPVVKHRVGKQLTVFVASHRDEDGVMVYRRVGVEREA
jgi:hypothetical protein